MRSQHLAMTWEAFELMPRKLGWKYEYWDGQAHISPRWQPVTVTYAVQPRSVHAACVIRPVTESDELQLVAAYIEAFSDSFDFCDWELEKVAQAAKDDIRGILSGQRGRLLSASRVAVAEPAQTQEEHLIGAVLITQSEEHFPLLDLLLVTPQWQRKGIATALVSAACNELHAAGMQTLESRYLLGNEESRAWHQQFGFTEEPDLQLARAYYYHAQHELWRREKIGDLLDEKRARLVAACEYWQARVEELAAQAKEQGMEAVLPSLRR